MKVDDLILQLQDLVNDAKSMPFSGGKVLVNSEEIYDIIDQIQDSMPAEVRQAKNIVADRKQIITEANRESENIIRAAEERRKVMLNQSEIVREAQAKADYERLFGGEVTESNEETVGALLRYLNTQNWGLWRLPKMTIGYQCNQYDCDGKQATTIKLDKPIVVNDVPGTMFEVGAPMGHLTKYRRI